MAGICYIFGAGSVFGRPDRITDDDYVIAADGGYDYTQQLGITANLLLGDFDSLGFVPNHPHIQRHPAVKNDTDMGLAVEEGLKRGYETFVLYGGLGGSRFDHSYANIQLLTRIAHAGKRGYLIGDGQIVTTVANGEMHFCEKSSGFLSVFCAGDAAHGVTLSGLKYELDDFLLLPDITLGTSNEFTGKNAFVKVAAGALIVMWQGHWRDVVLQQSRQ